MKPLKRKKRTQNKKELTNKGKSELINTETVTDTESVTNNESIANNVAEINSEPVIRNESLIINDMLDTNEGPRKKPKNNVEKTKNLQNDENGNDLDDLSVDKPKTHPCKLCKDVFGSMDELIMHAKIEHTPRKQKTFSVEDIEYFLKVFSKLKKSHCPICHKAILNTLNWRGHMYRHCVVKSVSCRVCGKSFTRSDHCKNHEARHKLKTSFSDDGSDE